MKHNWTSEERLMVAARIAVHIRTAIRDRPVSRDEVFGWADDLLGVVTFPAQTLRYNERRLARWLEEG